MPVQVAMCALAFYALTLSHGTTVASLPLTAKLAGWDSEPMTGHPLLWLLTLPLRVLPAGWIPPAVNLFSAMLAALVLGILVHSLELSAWTRPLATLGGRGRLPLLLAVALCGLEYNFWREATAATGEMLQLLLLASAIGCLLQYRVKKRFHWLLAAAAVWGSGLAESWMMVLTLPVFVVSVFRLRWRRLLSLKPNVQLVLAGLGGFSIIFIQPVANSFLGHASLDPVESCGLALKRYYHELGEIRFLFWQAHRMESIEVILFFLIPVVSIFIRPHDENLRQKSRLDAGILWLNRVGRALFLLACVWLAFDPVTGPRQILLKQTGMAMPLLSFDYLTALAAGYLAGNLLLALHGDPAKRLRRGRALEKFSRRAATPVFAGLLVVASLALLIRNTPAITLANREPLTEFAQLAMSALPPGRGLMLGDDAPQMLVFQAAAAAGHKDRDWPLADIRLLAQPAYRAQLAKKFPGGWLTKPDQGELTAKGVEVFIEPLVQTGQVCFLNNSCGLLFETFRLEPAGSIYTLKPYTGRDIDPPPLSSATMAATEKFWDAAEPRMDRLRETLSPHEPPFERTLLRALARLQIQPVSSPQTRTVADWYSVALDDWGVRLQRSGELSAAQKRFVQALELNTNNAAARLNLYCNTNLAAGHKLDLAGVKLLNWQLGDPGALDRFMQGFGPVDEPSFCYLLGTAFNQHGLSRQAMQQFERACRLAPDVVAPKLALAELYTRFGFEEQSRELIAQARNVLPSLAEKNSLETGLDVLEAESWLSQTNVASANTVLQPLLQQHSDDARVQAMAMRAYVAFGDYSNALDLVNTRLQADPKNIGTLVYKAAIYFRMGAASNTVAVLDSALAITNAPELRLLRADARVNAGQLAAAEKDYQELDQTLTNHLVTSYGLAKIALLRHDTNDAVVWLERCLTNVPANSAPYKMLNWQLGALKVTGK